MSNTGGYAEPTHDGKKPPEVSLPKPKRQPVDVAHLAPTPTAGKREMMVFDFEGEGGDDDKGRKILLNDFQLREDSSEYTLEGMEDVVEQQLAELLLEEFSGNVNNVRKTQQEYGMKLSLLVDQRPGDKAKPLELIGFLAYKPWGLPAPGVSIGAIGVSETQRGNGYGRRLMEVAEEKASLAATRAGGNRPGQVTLRALPSAVQFYERLGYDRVEEDETVEGYEAPTVSPGCPDPERAAKPEAAQERESGDSTEDEDDGPCVPMVRTCTPMTPGTFSFKFNPMSPKLDPWTPTRSRALEDGPTWPPNAKFDGGLFKLDEDSEDEAESASASSP